ncbi:MAG: glucose 1-dehydrogenase [Pirellulales bacterium]|nr:glucose 1-dehydrogenase [Pirellulales bacterium]
MQIKDKAAVVTGASSGVGQATAIALAKQGCAVLVNYFNSEQAAEETVEQINAEGGRAIAFRADVAEDAQCRAMIDAAVAEFGRLDVLVNNAGYTRFIAHTDLEAVTDDDWDRIWRTNVKGAFQCARAAKQAMIDSGGGEIVNVTSVAGISGRGSSIPYTASKAAMINMTVTLARVFAPTVRVNSVAPGFIEGRWTEKGLGEAYQGTKKRMERVSPLGRVCTPEDVAESILGVITGSDLVTGQTIVIDGGWMVAK